MPVCEFGSTKFEYEPDFTGKVRIATAEGSTVAVPAEDLLRFAYGAYVIPQRQIEADKKGWREGLIS